MLPARPAAVLMWRIAWGQFGQKVSTTSGLCALGSDSEGDTVVCVDVMHLMKRIAGRRTEGKLNNSRVFDRCGMCEKSAQGAATAAAATTTTTTAALKKVDIAKTSRSHCSAASSAVVLAAKIRKM